jgi:hypothetical protein
MAGNLRYVAGSGPNLSALIDTALEAGQLRTEPRFET